MSKVSNSINFAQEIIFVIIRMSHLSGLSNCEFSIHHEKRGEVDGGLGFFSSLLQVAGQNKIFL